jgi:ectoine hydroxylase-related dioxygenase (phytanoyl-CoA dioxygenase family)
MLSATLRDLTEAELSQYREQGYVIVRGLFGAEDVALLKEHFMAMHANPPRPHYEHKSWAEANGDPLQVYPRIMHPHRFDEVGKRYLLDPRVWQVLRQLLGAEPIAAQSMFYFKPAGARGQALHQDNFYLLVRPGTCIAAWTALDPCDSENGGLTVVPRTQHLEVKCPAEADLSQSFVNQYVAPPPGCEVVPADMAPGDVLFFNGNVIHGSGPNRSRDRFRRSFICHYLAETDTEIAKWYHPLLNAQGEVVSRGTAEGGGPCGKEVVV